MKPFKYVLICSFIITSFLLYFPNKAHSAALVSASGAILMEQQSGRVLYEKSAHEKKRIASITKIMTAILAIESGKLDETVTVSERAVGTEGSSIYLTLGEKIKLEDLVYGLMLRSGNDAAIAIAEHVGGSLEGFVFLMNQKAEEIGMVNTHFANPHGLDDHENHYSTAYDMALLTQYAMNDDTYKEISGTKVHRAPDPSGDWDRVWKNKNRLLTGLYEYTTGGKTGYTKRAKRTLVTTASKGNLDLIAVTLNGPNDWNDHMNMYEFGFNTYELVTVLSKGTVKKIDDRFYKNQVYVEQDVIYPVTKKERDLFHINITLQKPKEEWRDGKFQPDLVGKATILFDHKTLREVPLYYKKSEKKQRRSFFEQFKDTFTFHIGVKE